MNDRYRIRDVELEITNNCSHRCPYCYIGDVKSHEVSYSDYNNVCKVIDKLNEYGVEFIALLGGDPVLHPRIFDIMKYIRENTNCQISMMSNTLDFKKVSIAEASRYIDNIDFTLHGKTALEHEKFCHARPGQYFEIMSRLKEFISYGVNVNIAINIIPETYDQIYAMVESIIKQDIYFSTLLLQRIVPFGRAERNWKYDVSSKMVEVAFEQIAAAEKDFKIGVSFEDPYPFCIVPEKYHHYMNGCPEGVNRLAVNGEGFIASCGTSHNKPIGNILCDSYEDVWLNNPIFDKFRSATYLNNEKCVDCVYKEKCRGGCPIRYILSEESDGSFEAKFHACE